MVYYIGIINAMLLYYVLVNKGNKPSYWPIFLSWIGLMIYIYLWIIKYNGKE
jgi:hypothetical protein